MTRSHQPQRHLTMWLILLACLPSGCGVISMFTGPTIPEYRQPSDADIQQLTNRMMGKAPAKHASVSADGVQVVFQTGHASGIRTLALSPNGRYIASSGQDATVKIWDVASGQEVRTLTGYGMLGSDMLAFSPDSTRLVTADMTSGVKVIEVASGREVRSVGSLMAAGATLSADGRIAVARVSRDNHALSSIDLATGQSLWTFPDSETQNPVALSPDGTILLTTRIDTSMSTSIGSLFGFGTPSLPTMKQELLVWDLLGKKLRKKWPITMAEGVGGKISPDGHWLIREDMPTRSLILTDLNTGKPVQTISTGASGMIGMTNGLVFSPDGTLVALATDDGTTKLIEIPSGRVQTTLQSTAVSFSQDGTQLVLASKGGGAPLLRDLSSGKETRLAGGVSGVADLVIAPHGRALVAATEGGSAKYWDLATGQIIRSFDCPGGTGVRSVAVNDTGAVLATGCMDGSVWLWDMSTGRQLRNLMPSLPTGEFAYTTVRFTRDGTRVITAVRDQLAIWETATGKELRRIAIPHGQRPKTFDLMKNPSAGYEGMDPQLKAMMEERASDQPAMDPAMLEKMEAMSHWVQTITVHPHEHLVAVGKQHEVSLWNLQTGRLVRIIGRAASTSPASTAGGMPKGGDLQSLLAQGGFPGMPSRGSGLGSLFGFGGAPSTPPVAMMQDPSEFLDMASEQMGGGANSLAFSADGRLLLGDGAKGKDVWDGATGQKVRPPKAPRTGGFDPLSLLGNMEINMGGMGAAFSQDGRFAARGHGEVIKIWDVATGQDLLELIGHTAAVKSIKFAPDGRSLISGGSDGAVRIWNLQTGKEQAALIALGHEDFVAVMPDQYYRASKTRIKGVSFRVKGQLYPFEQFDLRFNRPDIVLARLGLTPPELIQSYRLAYEKRLKKMGLTEQMLGTDFHLPELHILTSDVPVSVNQTTLTLRVKATDSTYRLDRFNVFVNDIPIYGTSGLPLQNKQVNMHEQEIHVPLVPGRNKIQVSVLNQQGSESLRETIYTTSTADVASPDVYVLGIGVSEYKDKAYNLRYAAKDANDLLSAYKGIEQRPGVKGKIHLLDLTNQNATRPEILKAKDWLRQSKINDLVVVFAAGHGMTDEQSNYYFGTHDIDPKHPATNGLPYEEFELLLDGIPALQKLLLLDTCFSGEIEKDLAVVVAKAETGGSGTVKMRAFKAARGVTVTTDTSETGSNPTGAPRLSNDMVKFQQDWFADLRRGTGAAVISSSSGNEYSLEGEQWKNGVFTYALLNGLKNRGADANKDQTITVSELQSYVIDQVRKLTEGGQNPTVRRENLEYDFAVY
ncbi:MAG: caspase family protein [Nitrospiraceae bacterium]